jgi:hypothetical protein
LNQFLWNEKKKKGKTALSNARHHCRYRHTQRLVTEEIEMFKVVLHLARRDSYEHIERRQKQEKNRIMSGLRWMNYGLAPIHSAYAAKPALAPDCTFFAPTIHVFASLGRLA